MTATSATVTKIVRRVAHRARRVATAAPSTVPTWVRRARSAPSGTNGVNVIGYLNTESGMGQFARLLTRALEAGGVPVTMIPIEDRSKRSEAAAAPQSSEAQPLHAVNIMCVNADALPVVMDRFPRGFFKSRFTVGYWAWEVDTFPAPFAAAARLVDEVWALSTHAADAIARGIQQPVRAVPLPIEVNHRLNVTGPPDVPFTFLVCFDYQSVFQRKNPLAAVAAFRLAFPEDGAGPRLVIKTVNASWDRDAAASLSRATGERSDIEVIDSYLSPSDQMQLIGTCGAYVSLHRAEGFGLMLGEAMAYGRPVIATAYSGNLEFMTPSNSYLVPYSMVPIGEGNSPYPADAMWAQPDIDVAATAMRSVFYDRAQAATRADLAREAVRQLHSPLARADLIKSELARLQTYAT